MTARTYHTGHAEERTPRARIILPCAYTLDLPDGRAMRVQYEAREMPIADSHVRAVMMLEAVR